jgi:hypothetical protein
MSGTRYLWISCVYFCLSNITDIMNIQQFRKVALPPIYIFVGNCKQITILILDKVTSRLLTPLKLIYSSIQVSDVLVLTVCCMLINSLFQIFPLLIPEMSASFMSCIFQVIPIYLAWIR